MKINIYHYIVIACLLLGSACKKTPLNVAEVIKFTKPEAESITADNYTTIKLTAVVPPYSDPLTPVVFTTDLGTFQTSNSVTVTVNADSNGEAVAYLKSGTLGTATVKATAGTSYSAVKTVNFTAPDADNTFTVPIFVMSAPADGKSTIDITALVNKDLPASAKSVVFIADNNATFSNGTSTGGNATTTITADGTGKATAYLKSSIVGPVHVSLTAGGVVRNYVVNFVSPEPDNIFTVPAFVTSALADGKSTIDITALVNKDLPASAKSVVFTADNNAAFSNGTSTGGNATTTITADGTGKATAYLKSSIVGPVHVSLTAGGVVRNYVVNFISPEPDNIFTVPAFANNAPADGISTIEITALVNKSLPSSSQSVVFTADNSATFNNGTATGTITITADAAGKATALLKSSVAGPVNVLITAGGVSRNYVVNFLSPEPDNVFVINSFNDRVLADGASVTKIVATVNKNLKGNKAVVLTADNNASFSTGGATTTLNPDAAGVVTAYLKSSTIGESHVSLTCGGITRNITVNFDRSFPDMMLLSSAASLTSGAGNSMPITVTLLKNIGTPSGGFLFNYSAVDSGGNSVGVFSNQTASSATTGAATVSYSGGSSTYKGVVTITVSLQQNPAIKASTDIVIN